MSSEWQAVGLSDDPTPGDPEAVRSLATRLGLHATTAEGGTTRLRTIAAGGGGDLAMQGDYAAGYTEALRDLPDQLAKLAKAYRGAGAALDTYATALTDAKTKSGLALRNGLDAQTRYHGALAQVVSLLPPDRAHLLWPNDELSPPSIAAATAGLETQAPGVTGQVQVVARRGQDARHDQTLATRLAHDAKTIRDGAARTCAHGIDEALQDSGIKNKPWWKKGWDFAKAPFTSWDKFVSFCGTVALVTGVLAAVVFTGGAAAVVLGAVAFGAGMVVLGDSVAKWRQGNGSFGMVLLNAATLIPGGKMLGPGMKGLRGTSAAVRVGGRGTRLLTGTLGRIGGSLGRLGHGLTSAMPAGLRRAGSARGPLLSRANTFARSAWCRVLGRDPIDLASGQMILTQTDVELPGVLAWALARTYQSGYTCGRWFGPGWSSTLDTRLELDEHGICYTAPDGVLLAFPHPEPGGPAVLPEQGPRLELLLDEAGCYSILDAAAGQVLRFAIPATGQRGVALPLAAVIDRGGNTVEFGYDPDSAALARVSHSGGYQLDLETHHNLVTAVRLADPDGGPGLELVRYGYDDAGQLTHVYNSSGQALRFDYDPAGRIARWTDRNATEYRYTYDAAGRVVQTHGSGGFLAGTLAYDETRQITRETNSLGHVTEHHFTDRLRPLRQVDPLGRTTTFAWDAFDNRTAETDPLGRTVRYRYDDAGNLVEIARPDGTVVTAAWNEQRRPVTTVGDDGSRVDRDYDAAGNLTAVVDPAGARTRFYYDDRGRLVAVTDALGQVTQIETDLAGLPVTVIDPTGAATSYQRDPHGRIVAVTDPVGGVTRFTWTPEGWLTSRTQPDGATDTYRHDPEGNLVEHVDPAGHATRLEVTHFDLPAARTTPDGARLAFTYDTELRLTAVTSPQGLVWRYEYDPAGHLIAETDFNGRVLRYSYDAAGQLVARSNGAGQTVALTRDALGNIVEKRTPDGVTTFVYDQAGRLVAATSPDADVAIERDAAGRIVSEIVDGRQIVFAHDALGRRLRRTTPSGAVSEWDYDAAGRPLALRTAGRTLRFAHDAAGRELERLLDAGTDATAVALTHTWDASHRLRSQILTATAAGTPAATSAPAPPTGATARTLLQRSFSYCPDGYLTAVDGTADARRFDLDPAHRIVAVTGAGWHERYAYDAAGNITDAAWPSPDGSAPTPAPDADTPAEVDERGTRQYAGTLLRRAGAVHYEHDSQGRITLRRRARPSGAPLVWHYTWDAEDRLTEVTTPEGAVWRYHYDAFGRRTAKQRLTATGDVAEQTQFTWDGHLLAEEHQGTAAADSAGGKATTWEWQPGAFRPLTQATRRPSDSANQDWYDAAFYTIVTDPVGTPTGLVDPDGHLAWNGRTTVWGVSAPDSPGEAGCPLRFPGQYHDPESGLHYNYHRHYDPATARYTCADPLGLSAGPNADAYVTNPLTWLDPLGLMSCTSPGGAARVRKFTFGDLREGVLGETDLINGKITIQRGLTGQDFTETLRHETVHSILTPPAPLNLARIALYNNSGLYRYAEEAAAETYGTGSLWQGLKFPITNGYVSVPRLGAELAGVGAAGSAAGYRIYEETR